jgi:hypothetical protein
MNRPDPIGPWKPGLPPDERLAQWRGLRALATPPFPDDGGWRGLTGHRRIFRAVRAGDEMP